METVPSENDVYAGHEGGRGALGILFLYPVHQVNHRRGRVRSEIISMKCCSLIN